MSVVATQKEYIARVDSKKRVTIRDARFQFFRVLHRKDGSILLKPREVEEVEPQRSAGRRTVAKKQSSIDIGARPLPRRKTEDGQSISEATLRGMDAAMKSMRAGKRSKPEDLKKLAAMKI